MAAGIMQAGGKLKSYFDFVQCVYYVFPFQLLLTGYLI